MSFNGAGVTNTNTPKSQTVLVPSGDLAMATSGNLVPNTGYSVNLSNGQLGAVSLSRGATRDYGVFLNASDTVAAAPVIQLVQGTPNSSNLRNASAYGHTHKPYVSSAPINSAYAIAMQSRIASYGTFSSFAIGAASGTGAIRPQDESMYTLHVNFDGIRRNRYDGHKSLSQVSATIETPDFTNNAIYTDSVDYIVQALAQRINLQSAMLGTNGRVTGNNRVVAFAINTAGGSGVALGTGAGNISSLTVGSTVNFMSFDGFTYDFPVTEEFKKTVAAWVSASSNNIVAASTIEVIDLSTAGTAAGKAADVIVVMGLDEELPVVYDGLKGEKVRLRVGTENALNTEGLNVSELVMPFEGAGSGKHLKVFYDQGPAMQVYSQERWGMNYNLIVPPHYIDENKFYNVFTILHRDEYRVEYSHMEDYPHMTMILLESDPATGDAVDTTTLASLNAILAPWLNSCTLETGGTITFA